MGDTNYGDLRQNHAIAQHIGVKRLMLHARSLQFRTLSNAQQITVEAQVDAAWQQLADAFAWQISAELNYNLGKHRD